MDISTNKDHYIVLRQVYNPVVILDKSGEGMSVCERDDKLKIVLLKNEKGNIPLEKILDNSILAAYQKPSEILRDKSGEVIKEGDFMLVNPDDDSWLAFVIKHEDKLIFSSELKHDPCNVPLRDCLQGNENPAIIKGNIHNSRIEFHKF